MNYTVQTAASMLHIGKRALFDLLRRLNMIDNENAPKRIYIDQGLLEIGISYWKYQGSTTYQHHKRTLITEAGLKWLRNYLNADTPASGGANNTGSKSGSPPESPRP